MGFGWVASFRPLSKDGPEMVDGIVDIPLPGRVIDSATQDEPIAPLHFFTGPENRLVEVAVDSVLGQLPNNYNPLVLYGPSGSGKSHIAQGLAAEWKSRNRRDHVVCTTGADFARELADAIETQAVEEFRTKYRKASLLVFEDLGQLAVRQSGKLNAQEELVHTMDAAAANGGWVVVTASAAPAELSGILPVLQSRLTAGLTVPLTIPGVEARTAILQQLAIQRDIELPDPLAHMLAEGISGSAPQLAGALSQLDMLVRIDGGAIDAPTVQKYLAGRRGGPQQPSLRDIALATAHHFSLKLSELRSPVRQRAVVTARGVAIYIARRLTNESLDQIGRYFGGRDHTTVLHSCRKTESLLETDGLVRASVEQLCDQLWKT
jgi:chromosomal replication initiator protein